MFKDYLNDLKQLQYNSSDFSFHRAKSSE